jgi:hypothetical protein
MTVMKSKNEVVVVLIGEFKGPRIQMEVGHYAKEGYTITNTEKATFGNELYQIVIMEKED